MKVYYAKEVAKVICNYKLETSPEYTYIENMFFDFSQSMDKGEVIEFCMSNMKKALSEGDGSFNLVLRSWFLISYKMFCKLTNTDGALILEV